MTTVEPTTTRRSVLQRRIRLLVTGTITYNIVEAAVALTEGIRASSAALLGFGLDSLIEVSSAAVVAWQFSARDPESRERIALRLIAFSFFSLAAYVTADAVLSLLGIGAEARHSPIGIGLAVASLIIMPALSLAQRRTGTELRSVSAVADSKQTLLCTYLSAVLLVGLVLNALFGWSWADPVAALFVAALAAREGVQAWRGDTCCAPAPQLGATEPDGSILAGPRARGTTPLAEPDGVVAAGPRARGTTPLAEPDGCRREDTCH